MHNETVGQTQIVKSDRRRPSRIQQPYQPTLSAFLSPSSIHLSLHFLLSFRGASFLVRCLCTRPDQTDWKYPSVTKFGYRSHDLG